MKHEDELGRTRVKNAAGAIIPPFAVMQVSGATKQNGIPVVTVVKPDGTGNSFLLNGTQGIGSGGYGWGSNAWGKRGALDSAETAPSEGDEWGAKSGQWTLSPDGSGYTVVGDVSNDTARVRLSAGSLPAIELRGEVNSYAAIGASGNTYGIITLKTTSPAPLPLPTGTPSISGTVYVADVYGLGSSYFTTGKVIRAMRSLAVDTYSSTDVNWEHNDPTGDGVTPFVCMVIASLTAPTWDNANKRLTPAANTNTCKLLGWDSGNSRYDEATAGTTFSPDWIGPAITISSNKALKGWGVYHDGRYKLRTVDCSDNEVDYT